MIELYHQVSRQCSRLITHRYSTSFSLGIRMLDRKLRLPICSVYGFVRLADEIVDSFHGFQKEKLLARFRIDTFNSIKEGISLNPVLHAFGEVARQFKIEHELIEAFLDSMAMDLNPKKYDRGLYDKYIFGSAEVVGLMCLRVFTNGDTFEYEKLKEPARSLGAAFQKVNFLRDLKNDYEHLGRVYFPGVDFSKFTQTEKLEIEKDIENDFRAAREGIRQLPRSARFGVYVAYIYYLKLFQKIKKAPASEILKRRFRINNFRKISLLFTSAIHYRLQPIL